MHPPVDAHLGYFHILAIASHAAVNIGVISGQWEGPVVTKTGEDAPYKNAMIRRKELEPSLPLRSRYNSVAEKSSNDT